MNQTFVQCFKLFIANEQAFLLNKSKHMYKGKELTLRTNGQRPKGDRSALQLGWPRKTVPR